MCSHVLSMRGVTYASSMLVLIQYVRIAMYVTLPSVPSSLPYNVYLANIVKSSIGGQLCLIGASLREPHTSEQL